MDAESGFDFTPRLPRRGRKGDDPRMIGLWKIGRTIGKGSSGRVKIARHSKTGKYAAIKIVSKTSLVNSRRSVHELADAERIMLGIEREIVIMKLIDHPNIMRLYDVWETSGELYLILEYIEGGELFDYICEKGRLPALEALDYFQQLIGAIDYCHRFNIAHRDLKPENLLLDNKKRLRVADFGMAAWQGGSGHLLETACGSPHYAAPEVVLGLPYDGTSSDIWSCGVILYALLAGRLPFDDEDILKLLEKVKLGKYSMPSDIDPGAQDLISRMLEKNVKKRIKMSDILVHPWYTSQPPKNTSCPPPTLEELAKPVESASEIDADIFGNLRTLWNGAPDEDIIYGLVNDKQTWEKAVYHLLMKYRTAHLENYYDANAERSRSRKRSVKRRAEQKSPAVSPIPRDESLNAMPPRPATPRRAQRHKPSDLTGGTPLPKGPHPLPLPPQGNVLRSLKSPQPHPTPAQLGCSPSLATSPASPVWEALDMAPLSMTELQDENVQRFFQQIVDHLNVMQARPSGNSSSIISTPNSSTPYADKYLSATRYVHVVDGPCSPATPRYADGQFLSPDPLGLGITSLESPTSPTAPLRISPRGKGKENVFTGTGGILRNSSLRTGSRHERSALAERRVQILLPPRIDRTHPKKSSANSVALSPVYSGSASDASSFAPTAPRRSWFDALFKFKPASFQLLSMYDAAATLDTCELHLTGFGVRVSLHESRGVEYLRCRLDATHDPTHGGAGTTKAVQFRVELYAPTPAQSIAGCVVAVVLTQEKGALSAFRLLFSRLRREWNLDAPSGPVPVPSPVVGEGGRFVETLESR